MGMDRPSTVDTLGPCRCGHSVGFHTPACQCGCSGYRSAKLTPAVPAPGELWQYIAVGYCEWVNGDWPDDDDIVESRAPAKHIASYVKQWLDDSSEAMESKWEEGHKAGIRFARAAAIEEVIRALRKGRWHTPTSLETLEFDRAIEYLRERFNHA